MALNSITVKFKWVEIKIRQISLEFLGIQYMEIVLTYSFLTVPL